MSRIAKLLPVVLVLVALLALPSLVRFYTDWLWFEEVGFEAGTLAFLTEYLPSPGLTNATMALYLGTDLRSVPRETHGPEESHMVVVHLPLAEAVRLVRAGEIVNAAAVIGLLLAAERLRLMPS